MKIEYPCIVAIPYKILKDRYISAGAKIHYGCLAQLSKNSGCCWATNDQLAEMHKVSASQIQKWHAALEEKNYIERVFESKNSNIKKRKIVMKRNQFFCHEGGEA